MVLEGDEGEYCILRAHVNGSGYRPDEHIMPYLEASGFGSVASICMFALMADLISTLAEWWHSETHTFHLLCEECTINLEDVALQLGLPFDGSIVMSISVRIDGALPSLTSTLAW
ncbi:hypothetical protein PVK06_024946 [Gossypium arboreum]|uniref:Aminotransferase-like plant mobile domain-containing protein n=1 Tax=Gossypium arboreum TaxID=29729 RepID=A0ABR0PFI2_GOSAR|nr:hypothetical protein PVK06_024946 [Gossypium arboreum]